MALSQAGEPDYNGVAAAVTMALRSCCGIAGMVRKVPSLPMAEISNLCRKYGVESLAVFGSVVRAEFGPDSDFDFLVSFHNNDSGPWGEKYRELRAELANLLQRPVDLVARSAVERSQNDVRRRGILDSAVTVYES